jgi:hypothetical protein
MHAEGGSVDKSRILAVVVVVALIGGFFWLQPGQYLGGACEQGLFSLDCFKDQRDHIDAFYRANPAGMILGFFAVYVAVTALLFSNLKQANKQTHVFNVKYDCNIYTF